MVAGDRQRGDVVAEIEHACRSLEAQQIAQSFDRRIEPMLEVDECVVGPEFAAQRVDFVDDPSMRITAETPRTDADLATACPHPGALTGGEIDGG